MACHLLAGLPWAGAGEGTIRAIECQMGQGLWIFDDFVLTLSLAGDERRCAVSVKSYAVFTKAGAPREFSRTLWKQWLSQDNPDFRRERDSLTLLAAHHDPAVREAWAGLTEAARMMAPGAIAERCVSGAEPSPLRRAAFASLQLADEFDETTVNPAETGRLLGKFRLAEHDFQRSDSQSVTQAIAICQQILCDSDRARAGELWDAIVTYSGAVRRKGGRITLPDLLAELAHRFPVKQHPTYAADWANILTESRQRMESLARKIGGQVSVTRGALIEQIVAGMRMHRRVPVLGGSGNGKTVLSCEWAQAGQGSAVCFRAGDLSAPGGLRGMFRLSVGLAELFANASCPMRLVLDGLDKCFDEAAFDEASMVLRAAAVPEAADRWETVITCCPEDWERVRGQLIRRGIALPGETVRVGRFTDKEVREVCAKVPSLRLLGQRPHLYPVLCWPKALDLVATYWQATEAPLPWATESDFARWFWQNTICRDDPASFRDLVARKLAVQLADRMAATASLDAFQREEAATLAELGRDGHLEIDGVRRTVRFAHELTADWARQRELQVRGKAAAVFLHDRLHSPFWHRAVRFHGLDLLEREASSAGWEAFFAAFSGDAAGEQMAQNLLLEAPVFASNQRVVLDRLWPALQLKGGALLCRFLRQFFRVATFPDEEMMAHFVTEGAAVQLQASVLYRVPWVPYWPGVLGFLATRADAVNSLAREEVADLCILWLKYHAVLRLGMKDAARLAIVSASQVYREEEQWYGERNGASPGEKACQALLAAASVLPEEASHLALKFCGRRPPDAGDGSPGEERYHPSEYAPDPGPATPWAEGPQRPCAGIFRNAFLDGRHSGIFFRALPEVAIEVMFAVLLNLPHANWYFSDNSHDIDEHGFESQRGKQKSCFWISGPFLTFLQINPVIALPAIIRLVNFAADRGFEIGEHREHLSVPVTVDGETHQWRGHQFSMAWHQGHVFAPWAAACALLSLEKWLYLLMDAGEALEPHFFTILKQSRSIALAGVLICVGKRKPDLFLGPLRPVVEADFFWLENALLRRGEAGFNVSSFYETSAGIVAAWREWVQMPHRKETFNRLVTCKFLGHAAWRDMLADCRRRWQARLEAATEENPAPPWLARIASEFDPANWHTEEQEGQTLIIYNPPGSLPQPTTEDLEQLKRAQLLMQVPFRCFQILVEGAECSETQMIEMWAHLAAVRALRVPDEERGIRDNEDALCGIVAVAAVKHRGWLAADPEREQEAARILAEVGANPPAQFWPVEDDHTEFKWDSFAAWALTTFWCEEPDNRFLLQSVGALVMWDRNKVVFRVFSIAAQNRASLGAHFERLLAHAIRYAPARNRARMEKFVQPRTFDRDAWIAKHLETFLARATEPLPADWVSLADSQEGRRGRMITSGIDIGYITAALEWAEDLSAARDSIERETWLEYHRQSFLCALLRVRILAASPAPPASYHDHQIHSPYGEERRLIERIGRIVARLQSGEDHRRFWEPPFSIGLPAIRWIDAFVGRWMIEAGGHDEVAPAFVEQWLALLRYTEDALETPTWITGAGFHGNEANELWKELIGLSRFSPDFWDERMKPAVEAIRGFQERWAEQNVDNSHDASAYMQFLRTRAASNLRIRGLLILHKKVPIEDQYFWRRPEIRDSLAGFLRLLLDENAQDLNPNAEARAAFMSFALKLASLQHPLGSELLSLAGNRFGAAAHVD